MEFNINLNNFLTGYQDKPSAPSDTDTVKTEDFNRKFQDSLVYSSGNKLGFELSPLPLVLSGTYLYFVLILEIYDKKKVIKSK